MVRPVRRRARSGWAALAEVVTGGESTPAASAALLPVSEVQSPMAPDPAGILNTIVWNDLVGAGNAPLTRAAAMRIPAVARARHIIAGKVAALPLTVWRGGVQLQGAEEPSWVSRTDAGGLPPYHRLLWTVDDLLFSGWSLWVRRNAAPTDGGLPLAMSRVALDRWRFTASATIETRRADGTWRPAFQDEVVLIPGAHEGILNFGATSIREAGDLAKAAADAAANPAAYINLHYTGDEPLGKEERADLIATWAAARRGENGGVAYTNKYVEAKEMGTHEAHLLTEGRNAAAVDMARVCSVPAAMLDATNAGASLTYETTQGRNAELIDYGLSLYMDPITARLSMDDIVPRGQSVRFDTSSLRDPAPSPTGPVTED